MFSVIYDLFNIIPWCAKLALELSAHERMGMIRKTMIEMFLFFVFKEFWAKSSFYLVVKLVCFLYLVVQTSVLGHFICLGSLN